MDSKSKTGITTVDEYFSSLPEQAGLQLSN